jgi:hypothetical protein
LGSGFQVVDGSPGFRRRAKGKDARGGVEEQERWIRLRERDRSFRNLKTLRPEEGRKGRRQAMSLLGFGEIISGACENHGSGERDRATGIF